ncbi:MULTISPECIES: 4'-phosphopantetheinyl transferase family protein [Marinobacter]|uniref:4'-phosphopantetheinyl transferase superfamily protein n=1 Tax=Marinobacter xiaoshiensis TaxID=3073652 RepID=A0ABU2HE52_9GAMM|nr:MULTISPECIES: 4'-phosphopantetheinyl transferase superfamily protein [unclassified Marinobacter]MBK1872389.1 4'-phosphopantetheinyl transferase superfamily protein [Marinobacter sp. 1-3A]MBK1887283.1 4'-phosphopantetheinyl transferase superfamily protein [Marinobacter sp. DY40_1A1]MDS1308851.1 4'-phosphopantetheinyl transferase superfamily protein [Marinobacter sp. F60267]
MAGSSNGSNPDSGGVLQKPTIRLCHQTGQVPDVAPGWLTAHELDRFAQLSGDRAVEFLTSRWLIRQTLSKAGSIEPDLCCPVEGRPTAAACPAGWNLSLSHSYGLSACATQYDSALGIDIEPSKRYPQWQKVVKRWFSPVEQEWLFQEDDPEAFLQAWTLKEAWLKATGRGIAGNLQTLEVHRNFELYGDQPEGHWQACAFYTEGFLCTLVYRQNPSNKNGSWPRITLLEPPPDDYNLNTAKHLETHWEPLFYRKIHAQR